ncbi:MAG: hypothetical protein ACFFBD_16175, partial [Candidatus Hodarchaeota archaeon]
MNLLIKLARFVTPQEEIILQSHILSFFKHSSHVSLRKDPWASKYRLILVSPHSLSQKTISALYRFIGVWELSIFEEYPVNSLNDVIK